LQEEGAAGSLEKMEAPLTKNPRGRAGAETGKFIGKISELWMVFVCSYWAERNI
jgi:hypothetical protein